MRNPWRFSFDRKGGGLAIGDVGQDSLEEITLVAPKRGAGPNFGWSAFEGDERFQPRSVGTRPGPAVADLSHRRWELLGHRRLRGPRPQPASLYGRYLYGDFCKGELRSFVGKPGKARGDKALGLNPIESLSSFGTDRRGRIYVTSLGGSVFRLQPKG